MSAMIEDKGESIGVPKVCSNMILLNVKYEEEKTNFIVEINSFIELLIFFLISVHMLKILSIARSCGIFVNRGTTSKDIKISAL